MWLSTSSFLSHVMFGVKARVGLGISWGTGESGYFDTISMGFYFHCIVLQISMKFKMTFLIKKTKWKKMLVNFGPPLLHGKLLTNGI